VSDPQRWVLKVFNDWNAFVEADQVFLQQAEYLGCLVFVEHCNFLKLIGVHLVQVFGCNLVKVCFVEVAHFVVKHNLDFPNLFNAVDVILELL